MAVLHRFYCTLFKDACTGCHQPVLLSDVIINKFMLTNLFEELNKAVASGTYMYIV